MTCMRDEYKISGSIVVIRSSIYMHDIGDAADQATYTAYETYEYDENRNVAKVHEGRTIGQFGPGLAQPILKTI